MPATTLDAFLDAGFTYEQSVYLMQIITEGGPLPSTAGGAAIPPVNGAPSFDGSYATYVASAVMGQLVTAPGNMHPNLPHAPADQGTLNFAPAPPAMQALTCGLAGGTTCPRPFIRSGRPSNALGWDVTIGCSGQTCQGTSGPSTWASGYNVGDVASHSRGQKR
ncbi:hypothetical protein PAXINDRAFT_14429 [Paxillus involutus ATCC 200175]|uniref:Uncharacterized protein n=1 Tax=Paxillus involutus ATCC 200175 TaxID=664439 RepID=A0A0C9TZ90_PAXIN|nr:hypothetical protein PAXINDRAFT_14429 [Paxillus involutus ATCC 200175]